ncbi:MAG TPA: EAL domain-containing protein [Rhodocyclaceae bacterium]|nr:EAL domain-containing protein [Rhodocyclaceae bacterium]
MLQSRFLLREYWPWLVGLACAALFELLPPLALQQAAQAFQQMIVAQPLAIDPLPLLLSLPLSVALVCLAPPLCRRQGAGTSFLICVACLGLPLLLSALFLLAGLRYDPFAAMAGLWIGSSFHFARQLRETQRKLLRTQHKAATTLNAIADAVINVSSECLVSATNPVAMALIGANRGRLGQHVGVALGLPGKLVRQLEEMLLMCVAEGRTVRMPQPLAVGSHQMRATAAPIFSSEGRVDEVVLVLSDISDSVAAHEKLYHEARHDALTGLPNRTLLTCRITDAVSRAMQGGEVAALLFVDIDHFNRINDSFGHYIGDAILIEVAHRLQEVLGKAERVARWGGDEYVVLLDDVASREAVGEIAQHISAAVNAPMNINGVTLRINCSIGISLAPADSINVDELLAMADAAMARSKLCGDGGCRFYSHAMSRSDAIDIESALRQALQKNELDLYFQPQISLATGRLVGMEALLRWSRPGRGQVPPDHFIPVAEEIGLIIDIGVWTLHRAAQQLKLWLDAGLPVVPVAINISARQCLDDRITKVIADAVRYAGIRPDLLKIELTEATTMNNVDHVASLLRGVHGLGVRISVDDFGTGFSSLSYLKRFPISQLKIDRSFVHDIAIDSDDAAIVSGTIALARGLGIEVVAEGVETEEQVAFLGARGCDIAQGFYFSPPLDSTEASAVLRRGADYEWFSQPATATLLP